MNNTCIHLLLVDDHQIIIEGIKALLLNEEHIEIVAEANNGKEALSILHGNNKIDMILMDIEMPIMNGIDATIAIIKKYPQMKIIALSTYIEKSIIDKMLHSGAKGYILKNINKDILIDAIHTVWQGDVYLGNDISIAHSRNTFQIDDDEKNKNEEALAQLTKREIEIMINIANGLKNKEIGEKLFISSRTVETHKAKIMSKLDIHSTVELVKFTMRHLMD
jgi:DNA-binding NarL/FixJ family response regulator